MYGRGAGKSTGGVIWGVRSRSHTRPGCYGWWVRASKELWSRSGDWNQTMGGGGAGRRGSWSCPGKLWLFVGLQRSTRQWVAVGQELECRMWRWGQWGAGTSPGHLCLCVSPSLTSRPLESNEPLSCSLSLYNLIFAYFNSELEREAESAKVSSWHEKWLIEQSITVSDISKAHTDWIRRSFVSLGIRNRGPHLIRTPLETQRWFLLLPCKAEVSLEWQALD